MSLAVGDVNEQVKVTGAAALVSATTQDISGLVGEKEVEALPLNGRGFDLLLTLNPGIVNFTWEKTGGIGPTTKSNSGCPILALFGWGGAFLSLQYSSVCDRIFCGPGERIAEVKPFARRLS